MPSVIRSLSIAALLLTGCGFSVTTRDTDEPTEDAVDASLSTARCNNTTVTDPNLVLCLDFDTDPISDGSGRDHDPVVTAVSPGTRDTEPAAVLSATSIIQVGENADLDLLTNMTIEMWMRPNLAIREFYLLDNNDQYSMKYKADGKVQCALDGGANVETVLLPPNTWYHVGCTYDGATLKVYVNGKLARCRASTRPMSMTGTAGTAIGSNIDPSDMGPPTYDDHFVGALDNVHVFSRAFTSAEMCGAAGKSTCALTACPE